LHRVYEFWCAERAFASRVSWVKATNNDLCKYQCSLSEYLKSVRVPVEALLCADVHCCNASHSQAINIYADNIIEACISAGEVAIPRVSSRSASRRIPGWSEFVQPARDKSLFWHKLWVDCGRPRSGAVADCMRRTRAAYHYAIRKVRDDEDHITRNRFAAALSEHDDRNFWLEAKRIRSKTHSLSGVIDGKHDEESISDLFAAKYQKLYTSVSYEAYEMGSIINDLNGQLSNCSVIADLVKFSDVDDAVRKLKPHKSDCCDGLSSDHILNAGSDCLIHIALLFSAIIVHGSSPDKFLLSTVNPIPKGHNVNVTDSANYRGIAISSVFTKLFDNIVLLRYSEKLISSPLQFGFKKGHSTNLCTMVLKETIAYYLSQIVQYFAPFLMQPRHLIGCITSNYSVAYKTEPSCLHCESLVNLYLSNYVRLLGVALDLIIFWQLTELSRAVY
jgi:hypothetical protein